MNNDVCRDQCLIWIGDQFFHKETDRHVIDYINQQVKNFFAHQDIGITHYQQVQEKGAIFDLVFNGGISKIYDHVFPLDFLCSEVEIKDKKLYLVCFGEKIYEKVVCFDHGKKRYYRCMKVGEVDMIYYIYFNLEELFQVKVKDKLK
jgi:hypothetical protein